MFPNYIGMLRKIIDEIATELDVFQQQIDRESIGFIESLGTAINSFENAFDRLKAFVSEYTFGNEADEIHFFKEIKPQLFCKLIYYRKIYNIESIRPNGSDHAQIKYIERELDSLKIFFDRNIDFYKYYRSGSTHLDKHYFLRGKPDIQMTVESFYFERDPKFSTACDFKVAKILANELLRIYLNEELLKLEQAHYPQSDLPTFPKTRETWTGSKTDLVELIYAICETESFSFGKITRKRLADYFESVFNIDLGDVYRTYLEIRERNNRTQFLDELKEKLIKKMDEDDSKK